MGTDKKSLSDKIVDCLKYLKTIDKQVTVEKGRRRKKKNRPIYVKFGTLRSIDFKFEWSKDHYIGYFLDENGIKSQAVISIWKPIQAVKFAATYSLLIGLRANKGK
jgi:hypothetical protein